MSGWLLVAGDFTHHGGMDRANLELARYLSIDQPVHLVAHRVANDIAQLPNVTVHRVPRPFGMHLLGQPLLARAGRKWAARLQSDGYRMIVNGGNCRWNDVNWVHCLHAAYRSPVSGGRLRASKIRATHRLNRWSERRAIRAARLVICNSKRTARDVVELLGVDPVRVRVVYLGGDPTSLRPIDSGQRAEIRARLGWDARPWVGFVGQLGNRLKGFDTLYTAWGALCRDPAWTANLAIVGEGPDRPMWEARAAADGLEGRLRFLGFRTDVAEILGACDASVAPSRYDAYGLAVHESLCRGLPVIVSAAAGVSERYPADLRDLILNDPESPFELAERLRYWLANADALAARVRPLGDELRAHSWADMAREFVEAVAGGPAQRLPHPALVKTIALP
jgi:glycosyltransferase involved in cell wall biosynthesis